jgi:hypothetical protein
MIRTRIAFGIVLSIVLSAVLSACSPTELIPQDKFYERESPAIEVTDDPLKLAYFKLLTHDAGISYSRDMEGKYSAVIPKDSKKMAKLAQQAQAAEFSREKRKVEQTCATRRLQGYLREQNILSAFVQEEDGFYLIMDAKDYSSEGIEERLKGFEEKCAQNAAWRESME